MKVLQNIDVIDHSILQKENDLFKEFLKHQNSIEIDTLVYKLNNEVTPQIDCTQCGNCCRSLMINVENNDAERLSAYLNIPIEDFYTTFVERSSEGYLSIVNKIPCHFLHQNKCIVYEARPAGCREFPGLDQPNFTQRLFITFMHYARCPIIYNVMEALKEELNYNIDISN